MLERVDYDRRQHAVYARGRALSSESMARWMDLFVRYTSEARPLTVLDLGSGTGRFTPALAETFGGPVYGVEPFARMRAVAETSARHPAVTYLAGSAERIPLPPNSCDLVVLFLSFHHFPDRHRAADEIGRVLRRDGRVLLRGSFSDRLPDKVLYRYFPRARAIELEMFPSFSEVNDVFAAAGLRQVGTSAVLERRGASLSDYVDRLRWKASSTFEHLTEAEIEDGFTAIGADVADTPAEPIEERADLVVFARD